MALVVYSEPMLFFCWNWYWLPMKGCRLTFVVFGFFLFVFCCLFSPSEGHDVSPFVFASLDFISPYRPYLILFVGKPKTAPLLYWAELVSPSSVRWFFSVWSNWVSDHGIVATEVWGSNCRTRFRLCLRSENLCWEDRPPYGCPVEVILSIENNK